MNTETFTARAAAIKAPLAASTAPNVRAAEYERVIAGMELTRMHRAELDAAALIRKTTAVTSAAKTAAELEEIAVAKRAAVIAERAERAAKRAAVATYAVDQWHADTAERRAPVMDVLSRADVLESNAAARRSLDLLAMYPQRTAARTMERATAAVIAAEVLDVSSAAAAEVAAVALDDDLQFAVHDMSTALAEGRTAGKVRTPAEYAAFHDYRASAGYVLAAEVLAELKGSHVVVSAAAAQAATVFAVLPAEDGVMRDRQIASARAKVNGARAALRNTEGPAHKLAVEARAAKAVAVLAALEDEAASAEVVRSARGLMLRELGTVTTFDVAAIAAIAAAAPATPDHFDYINARAKPTRAVADPTAGAVIKAMTSAERKRAQRARDRAAQGVTVREYRGQGIYNRKLPAAV